jgi:hypothetical protein
MPTGVAAAIYNNTGIPVYRQLTVVTPRYLCLKFLIGKCSAGAVRTLTISP